uniref:Uncharacterized protein n=1 Tax=Siphoviridae sp. ctHeV6 TaxID=2826233 RepID=A0A8S5MCK6_9CAUD|nr:MAG TPA: hypothetical protein [Siphoviridae sp. ctHeV6]
MTERGFFVRTFSLNTQLYATAMWHTTFCYRMKRISAQQSRSRKC